MKGNASDVPNQDLVRGSINCLQIILLAVTVNVSTVTIALTGVGNGKYYRARRQEVAVGLPSGGMQWRER